MRMILILILTACEPSPCSEDIAALYDRGCAFTRPDGSRIDEAELRERCHEHIECAGDGCTGRLVEFTECLGGGFSVVCE